MDISIEPSLQPAVAGAVEIQGKRYWPRAGAYILDVLLIYGLNYIVGFGAGFLLGIFLFIISALIGRDFYFVQSSSIIVNYLIGALQMLIYFALFEWLFGRSFGKLLLGMRVVAGDGKSCNLKQAFTRSLYRLIDGLFFGLVASGYMKPPGYQRLGDQKASTFVVSSKDEIVQENPAWWRFWLALVLYLVSVGVILGVWYLTNVRFR